MVDWNHVLTFGGLVGAFFLMSSGFYTALAGLVAVTTIAIRHWSQGRKCPSSTRLDGKTVVITGGNAGIGKETARELSKRGARVVIGSRNLEKSLKVAQDIRIESGNEVIALTLDLASFASVRNFVKELSKHVEKIDILINNAGIMWLPEEKTVDGNEKQIQVNYLGHFLLTNLLLERMNKPSRIINLSSLAHGWTSTFDPDDLNMTKEGYGQIKSYAKSKLANILFTKALHLRFKDDGIFSYAVHPGTVSSEISTNIEDWFPGWWNATVGQVIKTVFLKTAENGAQTSVFCAVAPGIEGLSGSYMAECGAIEPSKLANDVDLQKKLWDVSERIVRISECEVEVSAEKPVELQEAAPIERVEEEVIEEVLEPIETKEKEDSSSSSSSSEDEQAIKYANEETILIDDDDQQQSEQVAQDIIVEKPVDVLVEEKKVEPEIVVLSDSSDSDVDEIKEVPKVEVQLLTSEVNEPKENDPETPQSIEVVEGIDIKASDEEAEEAEEPNVAEQVSKDSGDSSSSSDSDNDDNATKGIRAEIENFDKESLQSVETIEKLAVPDPTVINQEKEIIAAETEENKEMFGKVTEELLDMNKEVLKQTETIEQNTLPDKYDILKEKLDDSLIQDVETFDKNTLKTTTTHESESFHILQRQDSIKKNIESFDLGQLKPAETEEKVTLPNQEIIAKERELIVREIDLNKEIYGQVTEEIKQQKEVLHKTEVIEQNYLPDKYDILKEKLEGSLIEGVESFDKTTLKTTTTHESETLTILKRQDSIKKNIEDFDLGTLKSAEVEEKIVLPSQQVIEAEREFIAQEIESNKETFTKSVLQKLESFDAATELKHVENIEESDVQVIKDAYIQEKSHQKLMDELSAFEETNLSHVKTLEPMTPTDVAKTEILRSSTLESVTSFDKTTLKTTMTEEKIVLPDTRAISMEKQYEERGKVLDEITNFEPSTLKATEEVAKVPFEETVGDERLERELLTSQVKGDSDIRERSTSEGSSSSESQPTSSGSSWDKVEDQNEA